MEEQKKLKILLLEDNQDDVSLVRHVLQKDNLSFVSECADTRKQFNDAIRKFKPDVILSDHGLPGFNSDEALKICMRERPDTPFILVTGTVSDEYAISCLHNGADDYILKSNLSRLPIAIRSAVKKRKLERLKRETRHTLRLRNEELLKVNGELDNFVYSVSHNLRGPLASLMGLLQVAKEEDTEQKFETVHRLMHLTMNRLDDTLHDILNYSRNARSDVRNVLIDWPALVNKSFQKLQYLQGADDVEKLIHIDAVVPFYSDAERIGVIFNNLISNVIIYQDDEKESLIGVDVVTSPERVIIAIKDNGIGIREDMIPKVFGMFYRGSEKSQGAGLGLYIVKEIVERLDGTINIIAPIQQGTTVTVMLPNRHHR